MMFSRLNREAWEFRSTLSALFPYFSDLAINFLALTFLIAALRDFMRDALDFMRDTLDLTFDTLEVPLLLAKAEAFAAFSRALFLAGVIL